MTGSEQGQEPRIRVTDKRRFANMDPQEASVGATPAEATTEPDGEEHGAPDDLDAARAEAAQYLDHLQRLQAEFDNYRKRVQREQSQAMELGAEPVVRRLLEVVDDFELALMHATEKPDYDKFLHGVELVFAKLLDSLNAEGLERIDAQGSPFDPEKHEALMQTGEGEGEPVVIDILRPGYTLRGRVIRPAGVRVERR